MGSKRERLEVVAQSFSDAEVKSELERVLASASFRGSRRCHDFLQFVVSRTLLGDAESLKERTLAVEVFGRVASADLGEDSIVRVGAREVRKRLAQYYVNDGVHDRIRIDLPAGSYVPIFERRPVEAVEIFEPAPLPPLEPVAPVYAPVKQPARKMLKWGRIAAVLLLSIFALAALWYSTRPAPSELFESFWRPAFLSKSPAVIVLAHPVVYHPSTRASRLNVEKNGTPESPRQRVINLPPEALDGSDFVPVFDQYVGFGDAVAANQLATLFVRRSLPTKTRLASKLEFADLRDTTAILIGGPYTNRWTLELAKNVRFRLGYIGTKPSVSESGGTRQWSLKDKTDNGRSSEDYIVMCRFPRSQTGGFTIVAAGLTQYGTEEAGRILAEPAALEPILRKLPDGWQNQNLQIVLHARVVGDASASPELIAWHVW